MRFSDLPPLAHDIVVSDQTAVDRYLVELIEHFVSGDDHDYEDYSASVSLVPYAKNIGTSSLLQLFELQVGQVLVDLLGGAGQVAKAARRFGLCGWPDRILTADEDIRHVVQALGWTLPALPLDPINLDIVRNNAVDHILIAHHIHHLSPAGRKRMINQATRVLRPGGTLVIYEGPRGSSTAHLSDTVVDGLSNSPHTYPHPTEDELLRLADHPLLSEVRAVEIESPLVFIAHDEERAKSTTLDYYSRHYSLHPRISWETLHARLQEAYRRARNGDEVYIGELPELIEQKLFPIPADRAHKFGQQAVIVPRQGLAVVAKRSTD